MKTLLLICNVCRQLREHSLNDLDECISCKEERLLPSVYDPCAEVNWEERYAEVRDDSALYDL